MVLVPVQVQRPENQECWWYSSCPKANRLEIQKEKTKNKKHVPIQRQSGRKNSLLLVEELAFVFYASLQLLE